MWSLHCISHFSSPPLKKKVLLNLQGNKNMFQEQLVFGFGFQYQPSLKIISYHKNVEQKLKSLY